MEDNKELYKPVTGEEIEAMLQSMDATKAPGLDGFSGYFYKYYCEIVKEYILQQS